MRKVKPGSTVEIMFHTFDSNDPSASTTVTTLAVGDIKIYKDGGGTERASTSGFTVDDDFDTLTGIHRISIDLSDNSTANFYEAGSTYFVVVDSITVDAATVRFVADSFIIGYENTVLDTTIATLASQTSFTLEDGPADNDALNGCPVIVHDLASAVQVALGYVSDYVGSTKTVTLAADPGIFTMAVGDNISFFMPSQVGSWNNVPLATTNPLPNAAADAAGGLPISDAGGLDMDARLDAAVSSRATPAQVATALTDIHLDHLFAATYDATSKPGTADALLNEMVEDDAGVTRYTVNALENGPSGSGASAAAIADAVLDEALSGHTTAGTLGKAVADIEDDTSELQADDVPGLISALNDISVADVLTTQMTEAYAADGTAPTLAQALFLIQQQLGDFAISGTTMTVKRIDGSTTAATFTLDDGTSPTSLTRAT